MTRVDRTLLRENLEVTPAQRLDNLVSFSSFAAELRRAGQRRTLDEEALHAVRETARNFLHAVIVWQDGKVVQKPASPNGQ